MIKRNMNTVVKVWNKTGKDWEHVFEGPIGEFLWKQIEIELWVDQFMFIMELNWPFFESEEDSVEVECLSSGKWKIELVTEDV